MPVPPRAHDHSILTSKLTTYNTIGLFGHSFGVNVPLVDIGKPISGSDHGIERQAPDFGIYAVDVNVAGEKYGRHVPDENFLKLLVFGCAVCTLQIGPRFEEEFVCLFVGKRGEVEAWLAQLG